MEKIKNYSLAIIELIFYILYHYFNAIGSNTISMICYLFFCIGMLLIVVYGTYKVYQTNHTIILKDAKLFYLIIIACIIYGIHGIYYSLSNLI